MYIWLFFSIVSAPLDWGYFIIIIIIIIIFFFQDCLNLDLLFLVYDYL